MATIHIARHQQSLGSFSEEEVREGIRSGRFSAEDLAWREGMETWKPLGEMAPQWGLNTPPPLIAGEETAERINPLEIVNDGSEPAWENREQLGFFPAIGRTASAVLMKPAETFARMKHAGGLANPLTYYVILGSVVGIIGLFYQMGLQSQMAGFQSMLQQYSPHYSLPPEALNSSAFSTMGIFGGILLFPAWCVLGAFLGSGIYHLILMMVGGAIRPFETTFRVYCYAYGTALLFNLLPCCGWVIGLIWGSYILYVGFKEGHGIEGWKSLVAITLPGLLCIGCCAMITIPSLTYLYHHIH